uniref:GPI-anchored protein n=1 Tax=Solanum tuberosum TaxID=4113 RepID=M1BMQ0_SOLTU
MADLAVYLCTHWQKDQLGNVRTDRCSGALQRYNHLIDYSDFRRKDKRTVKKHRNIVWLGIVVACIG